MCVCACMRVCVCLCVCMRVYMFCVCMCVFVHFVVRAIGFVLMYAGVSLYACVDYILALTFDKIF